MYQTTDTLTVEADGPVRVVTINRPEAKNALDDPTHDAFAGIWHQIALDDGARAVMLTGAGSTFSAGGDIKGFSRLVDLQLRRKVLMGARRLVHEMVEFPLPVVAAVNGPAVGLGCSIAHLCDIVLIADDAYMADTHVSIGLVAGDGGSMTWPLMTSLLKAKEYLLTGEKIPADLCVQLGLANRVVPKDQLRKQALELAHRLAAQPFQSVQDTKRAINIHLRNAVSSVMNFAFMAESESFSTPELLAKVEQFNQR
jgi:enoyl-CoA hydratase